MRKCTPQEIIKEVPNVQSVVLPNNWFDGLSDNQSVFTSLYDWMLENSRIPSDNKHTLHNRTYVGEKIFKKLLAAEKKRISTKSKIKGDELDRAVLWSDINSGPKTMIGGCTISGDVILVIPESSKQALEEFSFEIYLKEREATINKIRANAAGTTFYYWLLPQIDRPDRVGDIARDAVVDENFPRKSNQYEEIELYLNSQGACSAAIGSLKEGWLEYIQQYPDRVPPYAWCNDCGERIDIKDASLTWSTNTVELFILDSACHSKRRQFDEIVSRPLSGISHDDLEELVEKVKMSESSTENLVERLKIWGVIPVVIEGSIYFIRSEKTQAIKIGFTAGKVEKRLSSLQTAHPYKLKLLAIIPGTLEYEKSLHDKFSSFRLEGEWFEPHPDLLAFISVVLKDPSGITKQAP